ncbi:unnamed protein product [Closterium sp. NIES-53]
MDGCSKKCTPAGITCCDALWIPSLTIPNVILYPQDRFQTGPPHLLFPSLQRSFVSMRCPLLPPTFKAYFERTHAMQRHAMPCQPHPRRFAPSSPHSLSLSLPPSPSFLISDSPPLPIEQEPSPRPSPSRDSPSTPRNWRRRVCAVSLPPSLHSLPTVSHIFSFLFPAFPPLRCVSPPRSSPQPLPHPLPPQILRLVVSVEGSGEFYLVGSNSGRQSEQGGGQLGGGGGTYVNDEVTGWKIASVALNCTPSDTTVSTSASYAPEDPWNAIPDNTGSSSSGAASNQSATCIFTIHIQRTSGVYVIAVLLPVILSVYLTFTAFVAKPEDLEIRLGACLTLFLALVAIQFVIDSQLPRTSAITNFGYLMIVSYIVIWLCTMETLVAFCIAERIEKNVQELVTDSLPPALSFKRHSPADKAAGEKLMSGGDDVDGVDSNDPEAIAEAATERRAAAAEEKQKKNVPGLLGFRLFGYHVRQSNPDRAKEGNYRLVVKIDVIVGIFLFTGYQGLRFTFRVVYPSGSPCM